MWRPYKLRGRMAGDSQLENNLVYSDGLQSILTLGGGEVGILLGAPSTPAGVQFRGRGHRARKAPSVPWPVTNSETN